MVHIVAQHRLHPDDPSSVAIEENMATAASGEDLAWHHLVLPMRYETSLAMMDRGFGADWRTVDGELLYPELLDESKVKATERALSPRAVSARRGSKPYGFRLHRR